MYQDRELRPVRHSLWVHTVLLHGVQHGLRCVHQCGQALLVFVEVLAHVIILGLAGVCMVENIRLYSPSILSLICAMDMICSLDIMILSS